MKNNKLPKGYLIARLLFLGYMGATVFTRIIKTFTISVEIVNMYLVKKAGLISITGMEKRQKKDATLKSIPKLNQFCCEKIALSNVYECITRGNIPSYIIIDMASWNIRSNPLSKFI